MRHRKRSLKLGRTSSHNRCMIANMLKSLIEEERIVTTVAKAKELRRHADRMITLAKKNTLASRRNAVSKLMDRRVLSKLFDTLGPRFENRGGGYTRIIKGGVRIGDNAQTCVLEFLSE